MELTKCSVHYIEHDMFSFMKEKNTYKIPIARKVDFQSYILIDHHICLEAETRVAFPLKKIENNSQACGRHFGTLRKTYMVVHIYFKMSSFYLVLCLL